MTFFILKKKKLLADSLTNRYSHLKTLIVCFMLKSCRNELEKANKVDENVASNVEVDPNTVSNNQRIAVSVFLNLTV